MMRNLFAPVAQLDRAPDFESVGREFESPQARHSLSQRFCRRSEAPTPAKAGYPPTEDQLACKDQAADDLEAGVTEVGTPILNGQNNFYVQIRQVLM